MRLVRAGISREIPFCKKRRQLTVAGVSILLMPSLALSDNPQKCNRTQPTNRWKTGNNQLYPFSLDGKSLYLSGESFIEYWNPDDGIRIWQQSLESPAVFRPRLTADLVISSGRSHIAAWKRLDGINQWSYTGKAELGVPLLHQQRLHFGQGHGLETIDVKTGEHLWSFDTTVNSRIGYAPAAIANTLFLGAGDGVLYALSCNDGKLRWKVDREKDWQYLRQLAVSGETLVCGGYHDEILGLDINDGGIRWRFNAGNFINSQLVHNGTIYFWSPTGWVYALNASNGEVLWRTLTINYRNPVSKKNWAPIMSEMVADKDYLYVLAMDNVLHILDLKTGKEVERFCLNIHLRPFIVLEAGSKRAFIASTVGELIPFELNIQ